MKSLPYPPKLQMLSFFWEWRIKICDFKSCWLHCRDFSRILSNAELCWSSGLRSFNSVRIIRDTTLLHGLCTSTANTPLTLRLIEQSLSSSRFPKRLSFFDNSIRRYGRQSFINRAKLVAELILFEWADLSHHTFTQLIKRSVQLHIAWLIMPAISPRMAILLYHIVNTCLVICNLRKTLHFSFIKVQFGFLWWCLENPHHRRLKIEFCH